MIPEGEKAAFGLFHRADNALENDHDWLLVGDVFTRDVIETWIACKREREFAPVNLTPDPYEFFLYFDL
jgi:glutamine synthetase